MIPTKKPPSSAIPPSEPTRKGETLPHFPVKNHPRHRSCRRRGPHRRLPPSPRSVAHTKFRVSRVS